MTSNILQSSTMSIPMKTNARPSFIETRNKSTDSDSTLTKPLLDTKVDTVKSVVTCPCPDDYHDVTGLVHCVVNCTSSKLITMKMQHSNGDVTNLLTAKRGKLFSKTRYIISTCSELLPPIASLKEIESNFVQHTYALEVDNDVAVAYILYVVPKIQCNYFCTRNEPRRAEVALYEDPTHSSSKEGVRTTSTQLHLFQEVCRQRLLGPRRLSVPSDVYSPTVLQSVAPKAKQNGRYGLDFHGRGRSASRRNMQLLVSNKDDDATIVLQMAKWDDKIYHVDFKAPLTPLQAFGWALAQIDLK
ncbi:hypothetical protein MPSEU_001080700 [Mayamaea pseudoterrestris]|nr:hypothetical protein MPSEU_001080700 [Mayamaea pseudoterrestris]